MDSVAIVQRNEGKTITDEFLGIVATERDEYMGFAMADGGELILDSRDGGEESVIIDIKDTMKNSTAFILCFGKGVQLEEDRQPFKTLTDETGKPICVAFIEGDFQGFEPTESSHSVSSVCHSEYLCPKVMDIFTTCGEDIDKTIEKLNSALVRREIMNTCFSAADARGEIVLLFANGKKINFFKGDKHKKFDWGETSLAFAYEEKSTAIVTPSKARGPLGKPQTSGSPNSKQDLGKATSTVVEGNKLIAASSTAMGAAIEDAKNNLDFMIVPPPHRCQSAKDLGSWYDAYTVGKPNGWERGFKAADKTVPAKVKAAITNKTFNTLLEKKQIFLAPDKSKKTSGKTEATLPDITVPITIIPAKELDMMKNTIFPRMVKAYDDNSNLIISPEKLAEYLKDKPKATEQLGIGGLVEFDNYSDDAFRLLQKDAPETVLAILSQYRLENWQLRQAVKEVVEIKKAM